MTATPPDGAESLTSPAVVGPAYAAVYEVIRKWPGSAERNAVIWRAVEAYRAALPDDTGPETAPLKTARDVARAVSEEAAAERTALAETEATPPDDTEGTRP